MARNFLTPINLSGLELQDAAIQGKTTSAINAITPASGGRIYYDSQTNQLKVYNGSAWVALATGGSTFTLGSTSIAIGGTTTTVAGLTLSGPTFSGTITTGLSAGYATINAAGALVSVSTIPNSGLTNNSISGIVLGNNLASLTISSPLSGTTYNGSTGTTIALASGYGDTQNPYASKTANTFLAAPNGSNGAPTFRTIVAADVPSLGNISNAGAIGSTSGLVVSTTTSGVLTASSALPNGTTATTQSASNNSTHVATTAYVDTAVANGQAGFNVHAGVVAASTTNITGTYTAGSADQSNGTGIGATFVFTAAQIDGVTLATTNRVLLKNQTNAIHNGVYVVTTVAANITLTRASDFDNSVAGEVFNGDLIYVQSGGQGGTTWVMNKVGTATTPANAVRIGTDDITWAQFAGAGTYTGTNGVTVSGTVISGVDATTSSKGVASFTSTQFTVSSGAVSITNLAASVVTSGTLSAARGGTGADLSGANSTQYGLPYFSSAGVMASTAAGASTQVLIGNASGAPSWTNISGLTVSAATTATNANNVATTASTSASTFFPTFVGSTTNGNQGIGNATNLTFVPSTGTLSATVFSGSGASLTSLNASNLASGTIPGDRGVTAGSTTSSFVEYNGTTATSGQFDGGTTAPSGTTRLNYGGNLYATNFFGNGANLTSLDGSNISSGTVADGRIASALTGKTYNGLTITNNGTNTLNIAAGKTLAATASITLAGTDSTTMTFPGTSATIARTDAAQTFTGTQTFSTISGATTLALLAASAAGAGNALTITGGASTNTTGLAGGAVTITGGASTSGTSTNQGGSVAITGGASNSTNGVGGNVTISGGQGSTGGGNGTVTINGSQVAISSADVVFSGIATGTAGFVKIGTTGALSRGAIVYSDLPTSSLGAVTTNGIARKASGPGTGTSTNTFSVNHGFGQWVTAQLFLISSGELVEVDVTNASTSNGTTTFTFAATQTNMNVYQYVIIG